MLASTSWRKVLPREVLYVFMTAPILQFSSTNKLAARKIEEERKKEEEKIKKEKEIIDAEVAFESLYGMTSTEAKEEIDRQLKLTYQNSDIMAIRGDYMYFAEELVKMNDIPGITIWRNISSEEEIGIRSKNILKPDVKIYKENLNGEWKFTVCHDAYLKQVYLFFEYDEDGWYVDRMGELEFE